jgi:hypothetical protein
MLGEDVEPCADPAVEPVCPGLDCEVAVVALPGFAWATNAAKPPIRATQPTARPRRSLVSVRNRASRFLLDDSGAGEGS